VLAEYVHRSYVLDDAKHNGTRPLAVTLKLLKEFGGTEGNREPARGALVMSDELPDGLGSTDLRAVRSAPLR
jgi:hypothetical protein